MNGKTFETHKKKITVALAVAIAGIVLIGIFFALQTPAKTLQTAKDTSPTAVGVLVNLTPRVPATPSPTKGQEPTQPISNQWYSISEKKYREGEKFQYNGINFVVKVSPNGRGTIVELSQEDIKKLWASEKSILIKMKFRAIGKSEIFEAPIVSYGGQIDMMKGWAEIMGSEQAKNLLPSDIEWQPEFGLKNKFND